jgi:nucleoid-associated protein YgaU
VALRPSAAEEARPVAPSPPAAASPAQAAAPAQIPISGDAPRAASSAPDKASPEKQISPPPDAAPAAPPVPGGYYKVVRGDMLSQIALVAYRDASQFLRIQKANPGLRFGPDKILVDQVIFIPPAP